MEMLEDVSRADGPDEAIRAYATRIRKVRPIDAFVSVSVRGLPNGSYRVGRVERADRAKPLMQTDGSASWDRSPVRTGGIIGALLPALPLAGPRGMRDEPRIAHELATATDPVLGDALMGMGSCMSIPVLDEGRAVSWWFLFRRDPHGYGQEDLEEEVLIGNLFGALTRHMEALEQNTALSEKLRAQFDEVARVQRALLPTSEPRVPGVSFATSYLTSGQAGGDYYDFLATSAGSIGVFIADVSGHGPAAATVMAMLHAILHARPELWGSPAELMYWANERLASSSIEGGHVTAVYGVLDAQSRVFEFVRAGHPIPRVRSAAGEVRGLNSEAGPPMGIVADRGVFVLRPERITLAPGETVVLYTDGASETESPGGEQIGVDGLDRAIAAAGPTPADVVHAVERALVEFRSSPERADDQTLVVFRVDA